MANKKNPSERPAASSASQASLAAGESVASSAAGQENVGAELPLSEEAQRVATEYYQKLSEAAARLTEQSKQLYDMSHEYAREHPVGLIAGAFVAGLLVGLISNRN